MNDNPLILATKQKSSNQPIFSGHATPTNGNTYDYTVYAHAGPSREWAREDKDARIFEVSGEENVGRYTFTTLAGVSIRDKCGDIMDHRPNVDSELFDYDAYKDGYAGLVAWDRPDHDPAVDIPAANALDTLRRRGIKDVDIDKSDVLPLTCAQLDRIPLERPGIPQIAPAVDPRQAEADTNMCPLCLRFACVQHMLVGDEIEYPPPSIPKASLFDRFKMFKRPRTACGPTCWTNEARAGLRTDMIDAVEQELDLVDWTDQKSVCHLAAITGLLCTEVWRIIQELRNDPQNREQAGSSWCERDCSCPPSCIRHFRGCRTAATAHWNLHGKFVSVSALPRTCGNMAVQADSPVRVRVGKSEVAGFGLFLEEPVNEGQFLMYYTGDAIDTKESLKREMVFQSTGRNYLFEVRDQWDLLLDAGTWGNASRFINTRSLDDHSSGNNCYCMTRSVLGEMPTRAETVGHTLAALSSL
ncbi:hypothetical protein Q5752_006455 [Cryptotrichosporon argae]